MGVSIPVEAGQIMILARALGDDSPAYRDASSAEAKRLGGIIAPPTFTELRFHYDAESGFRARFDRPWYGSGKEPTGTPGFHPSVIDYPHLAEGQIMMPGEVTFEYFEHIRPGDVLTMTESIGESWEKETATAGKLTFVPVLREFRNQDDVLVTAQHMTFLIMEKVESFR